MNTLSDNETRLLLSMVDKSAAAVAPDEHADAFEDFADIVRETRTVPGFDPADGDEAAAGMLDVDIYLGVGLALLGQIGLQVLSSMTDLAVRRGVRNVVDLTRRLFRRGPAAGSAVATTGPADGEATTADGEVVLDGEAAAVVDAVSRAVLVQIGGQVPVTPEQIRVIVTIQLRAIAESDIAESDGEPAAPGRP